MKTRARNDAGRLPGDAGLRTAIDELANQLCLSVDGNFDFAVHTPVEDQTLEKLSMLVNFVVDTARRGMGALNDRNRVLAELDQAKTVFFSNASHELRTPLTLMLGPLEDALSRPDGALSGESLAMAYRNAVRLHKLVNALLDFSRIEAGRLQVNFQPTDLAATTMQLAGVFRAVMEQAGLALVLEIEPLPEPVWVDRDMWEKIVLNLVSNAFKFTLAGSISVSLRARDADVELQVRDTGIGIPAAVMPRLFERFFRVPGTRGRTHEGFGIGLAMIHELVRLHGGTVEARSEQGAGTTFTVRVPRGPRQSSAAQATAAPAGALGDAFAQEARGWAKAAPQPAGQPPVAASRARILLADDNADMRSYVSNLLSPHWIVEAYSDGEEALQAARRQPPDLVLADIMMPGRDGFALMRELRSDPATREIPIVLLSARSGPESVAEGLESGADDYLVKPFAARELLARVRTHLELSQLRMDSGLIQRVGALLGAKLDLREVVQTLTNEATRFCGAAFGAFFYNVVDAAGERYTLYTIAGVPRELFEKFPLPRNTAVFDPTFSGRGIVRSDDITKDPRYGHTAPYHGMPPGHLPVRSYLAVPVVSRAGTVLGGLFLGHGTPGVFTERSERLLSAVATHAAVAIDNAHLYESELRARAQAESANRAKDEFLAMLGHELRNPLAPIVTALDVMDLQGAGSIEQRAMIRRQVEHVGRLVDDLLDVSRITRGVVELDLELVELAQVVAKGVEIAGPLLRERRNRVTVAVPAQGLAVMADRVRLAQVVSNLLNNAAKYSEAGTPVMVTGGRDGSEIVLRVRDQGIGITAEMMPRIFDHFVQGPQSIDRSKGGLGLGLAIVRSLVAQHGGTVRAHSDGPGRGSEFEVRLPIPRSTAPGPSARAEPEVTKPVASRRILVVDDNADAAQMLAFALELGSHTVHTAHDGPAAVAAAREFRPEVVLLDLGLPLMDGYEVARALRAEHGAAMRIVALTGYGEDTARRRSAEAGFDEHLVKPLEMADLTRLFSAWYPPPG